MTQYIIAGLVLGGIYALASAGLTITYVSTGILNFAFGAMAYFVARFHFWLNSEQGWGLIPSAAISLLVLSPLMGLFLYLLLFRAIRLAPALIKVVVTIGVSVTIPGLAVLLFGQQEIISAPGLAPRPLSLYNVFGGVLTSDQVVVYVSVAAILVVGALVLRFTEAGLSIRAMVDSEAMTSLTGTNPGRVAMAVWAVSTFIAGLAGILAAPVIGLEAGSYTLITAAAFAAVIAARLKNLPIAVGTGFLMGLTGSMVQYLMPAGSKLTASITPSIPFAFIMLFLVYNIVRYGRVAEEEHGGALDRAIAPAGASQLGTSTTAFAQRTPFPRLHSTYGPAVFFALYVLILPWVLEGFWLSLLARVVPLAIALLFFTIVTGEGGMLWLCQITFAGMGALTTGQLATVYGWPVLLAVFVGGLIAAFVAFLLGFLTLRLSNLYVALVTLTFGLLVERLVFSRPAFDNFGQGVRVPRPSFAESDLAFVYLAFAIFAVIALLIVNLRRSTTGLAINAVRWSESASQVMGLSTLWTRLLVVALGAFVAGVGGGLIAISTKVAQPVSYAVLLGLVWLAVTVTFGVRSNLAALLAATAFIFSPALFSTYLTPQWNTVPPILFGLGAIMVSRNPDGTLALYARQIEGGLAKLFRPKRVPEGSPDDERAPTGAGAVTLTEVRES